MRVWFAKQQVLDKKYKAEQHNTRQNNTEQIFIGLNNFLFYMIFEGRNAILVF